MTDTAARPDVVADGPRTVVVEVWRGEAWHRAGSLSEDEPAGSISGQSDAGCEVYIFGWLDGDGPRLWRSTAGLHVENVAVRAIASAGLEPVADLAHEAYELDRMGSSGAIRVRFRMEA